MWAVTSVLAGGCGGTGDAQASAGGGATADSVASRAGADSSAGAVPAAVKLSAAQVAHGGIGWAPVSAADLTGVVELPGQLVPNEDRTARIGAPAQGRIVAVHVQPGDRVGRGQPLVTLQSPEASAARADYDKAVAALASARAAATYARTARERAERLLALKAASRQEAERAVADDEAARALLRQAAAEVARARSAAAQLGDASAAGTMVLRSPVDGIVLSRDAVPGTVASAGTLLVVVADTRTLWLDIAAPDSVASGVHRGTPLRFRVPAFPGDTFAARVQSVGGALDTATRTVPVRATVANPRGRLRPAMFATIWIEVGERRAGVLVPDDAVQLLGRRPVVFIARPAGRGGAVVEWRTVRTGATSGGRTPILAGAEPGDLVVQTGAFAVKSIFARARAAPE